MSLASLSRAVLTAFEQPFIRNFVRFTVQDPAITAKESFNFWRSKGAPIHLCWSCLGNEQRETGFNWTAVGDRGTAHGISQWHEARRQEILSGTGIDVNTAGHKGQLAAMYWELSHMRLWDDLLSSGDVNKACDILVRKFERPAQVARDIALQVGFANDLSSKYADWEKEATPQLVVTVAAAPAPAKVVSISAPAVITKAKGAFPTQLRKAGSFQVVQDPCPHFSSAVDTSAPRAGVLHTTEGYWAGAMGVFKQHFAPHFLVGLNPQRKPQISQLVPVGVIGAALKAHNDKAIVQVEMVSFSKAEPWLPDSGTLDALASLMLACRDEYGIPLEHPWADGDFGKAGDNPHRHSGKFGSFAGWLGHGDVPQPDSHWDPGALRWSEIFNRAGVLDKPIPSAAVA